MAEYRSAIGLMVPRHAGLPASALGVSAIEGTGLHELWGAITTRWDALAASGELARLRGAQARAWLWDEVAQGLREHAEHAAGARGRELEQEVAEGRTLPHLAAARLLDELVGPER